MKQKIFSFFSGAGFLDYGFETEGFTVSYVNEYHKPFLDAYKYSREQLGVERPEFGYFGESITKLFETAHNKRLTELVADSKADGSLVGFIGGPPCPDFSVAGKNRGQTGENGKLSRSYVDLIIQQSPDFFLFENVKGLYRTSKHRMFYEELKADLSRKGYKLTEKLINAIEYGAPQDRERVILLGFRESDPNDSNGEGFDWNENAAFPNRDAFSFRWSDTAPFLQDSVINCPGSIPPELTVEFWWRKNGVQSHPNEKHCFTPRAGLTRFLSVDEGDVSRKSYKRLHRWRYSPTAAYGNNEVHLHPYKARRISVAEALAIQSLPKEFSLPSNMTLSNMFKTVGNGVPYLAAKMLARTLKSYLEKNTSETHSIGHCAGD